MTYNEAHKKYDASEKGKARRKKYYLQNREKILAQQEQYRKGKASNDTN